MHGPIPPLPRLHGRPAGDAPGPYSAGPAPDGVDALRVLWRRKATVIGVTGLVVLSTLLVVLNRPSVYTATAEIILAPPAAETSGGEGSARGDVGAVASEVEVLRSRGLLRQVVRREQLLLDPEFNSAVRRPSGMFARIGLAPGPAPEDLRIERQRARTVAALDRRLSVHALGRSRVIEIAVRSGEPEKAARLADAVARAYLRDRREARSRSDASIARHLRARVAEARKTLARAERAHRRFRKEAGLVAPSEVNEDQFARLRYTLARARAELDRKRTRVATVEQRLANGGPLSLPAGLASPLLKTQREELAAAVRRKSSLSAELGPQHPEVLDAQARIERLRQQAGQAARGAMADLRDELRVAEANVRALDDELSEMRRTAERRATAEARLAKLGRELEAARERHDSLRARLERASFGERARQPGARVISSAAVPQAPDGPGAGLIMALALLAGVPCGVTTAVLMERLDRGIAGLEQLGAATRLTPLAMIPRVPAGHGRMPAPADEVLTRPASAFAASIDRAYTSLLQASAAHPPGAVLITSALPREGKTTVALALARTVARRGGRVVLVEADLRRPNLARSLGFARQPGLAEYLVGRVPFKATIRRDRQRGLHVLPAGRRVADAGRMLSSRQFAVTLRALTSTYDCVIVDAPPVLPVADARVLAPLVDASILVARWRKTPGRTAGLAARELRSAGAILPGALLTRVDPRRSRLEDTAEQPVHGRAVQAYYAG